MAVVAESVLSDQILTRCRERAPGYDKDNRFFQEDFDELTASIALTRPRISLGISPDEQPRWG